MTIAGMARIQGMLFVRSLPVLMISIAIIVALLKNPWFSGRTKRFILAGLPLFPVLFLAWGFVDSNLFTLMIEAYHPWYTQYTAPFWLLCMTFIGLPNILLLPIRGILGRGVFSALSTVISIAWVIGLMATLWIKSKGWFQPPKGTALESEDGTT